MDKDPAVAQRDKIIMYKRVFGGQDGKEVLLDLMNNFHVLNTHGGDPFKEGQRSVVVAIMKKAHIDLVQLDKLLKGEPE